MIYGPGGIGKTELSANIVKLGYAVQFLDISDGSRSYDVRRVEEINSMSPWEDLRGALHAPVWDDVDAVILDDATKSEELAVAWTIANVAHEKGPQTKVIRSIEDYGFGKGYQHAYETWMKLLGDLDAHVRAGRHVVVICHDCVASVPNPGGEDYIRYEPRLQAPASGKASIRHRLKEWCDHLLFLGYDVFTNEDGKATGSATRTIYPTELPTHWAKSRKLARPIPFPRGDVEVWKQLLGDKNA